MQISVVGAPGVALQTKPDPAPLQTHVPVLVQAPTPTVQEDPFSGQSSSVVPLQLSSTPLQSSVLPGLIRLFASLQSVLLAT